QLGASAPDFKLHCSPAEAGAPNCLDAAPLRRPHPVVRDRSHVADAGDRKADRLEGTERALAAGTGTLDLDLQGADAVVGGLAAGILGGDLRGVRRRLAAALEAHHPGTRPGNRIALRVGDGDHGVVEAGVHVGDAGRDVLALPPADALRCLGHFFPTIVSKLLRTGGRSLLLLLARDRLGLALAGARVGVRALAAD